ncbi:MAG: hypothetical protein IT381_21875 [Deltaproteobacteria bacterium]|nr:hypothetical protein [Deltaproteobacteria bacterium]
MRRSVGHLFLSVFVATALTLSASHARASDDDELEKILQQGLKEIDSQKPAEKKAEPKKDKKAEAKKEEPKKEEAPAPVKKEEPKKEAVKKDAQKAQDDLKKAEAAKKEEAKKDEPRRAPIGAAKEAAKDPAPAPVEPLEEPKPAPAPVAKPTKPVVPVAAPAPVKQEPVKEVTAAPSKPLEVGPDPKAAAKPAAAATASKDGKDEPKAKRTVSMAVNADQAALSGASAKAWSVNLSLNTSVGSGAMLTPGSSAYAYNPEVTQSLTINPGYTFSLTKELKLRVTLRESFSWEFTKPDNAQYFTWSDLTVGASSRLYQIPVIGVDIFASLNMVAPISRESRFATLATSLSSGLGLAKNWDIPVKGDWHMGINLRYDLGFRKNFHTSVMPLITSDAREDGLPLAIRASTDPYIPGSLTRGGGINVSHTLSNALTLSWSIHDMVSLSFFASVTNGWKYAGQGQLVQDEFTSSYARLGPGRTESMRTNIDLTIQPWSWLSFSVGIFTAQPIFAPDNKTFNNPIWNSQSAANNYSSIYLSLGGQI